MKDWAAFSLVPSPEGGGFADMPAEGRLSGVSALGLLSRLSMAHAHGHLLLENEGGRLGFVFQHGKLAATESTWPRDTPERWLLAEELLAPMEVGLSGFHIGRWSAEHLASGRVERAQLLRCFECAAEHTLVRAMRWTQGSYVWQEAMPEVHMPLSVEDNWTLFLSAARALPEGFLRQHLEAFWRLPWKQTPHALSAESLPWQAAELVALHRLKFYGMPAKAVPNDSELCLYARVAFVLWQAEMWSPAPSAPSAGVVQAQDENSVAHFAVEADWEEKLKATQKAWEGKDAFSILGVGKDAQGPERKRAYFALVRRLHPDKLPPEASESAKQAAAELFAQLGEAYRCLSDEEARAELLLKLNNTQDEPVCLEALFSAEDLFRKAARMVASRRFAEALPLLEEALRLNPEAAEYWAYLGYAKRFLPGHGEKAALKDLEKAKQQNPNLPDTYYFLGRLGKLRKETTLAKALFEKCLSLEPKHAEAQQELRLLKSADIGRKTF